MTKKITMICIFVVATACSSGKKTMLGDQRVEVEESVKEDKIHGDPLPDWANASGIENGRVFTVGVASFPAEKAQILVEKAALLDGETKLLSDAPTDFRSLAQSSLNSSTSTTVEFSQIDTRLKTVKGLTGIKYHDDKLTCRKIVRYGTYATVIDRQCWAMVSVPIQSLKAAYERTIQELYGDKTAEKFSTRMDEELKKIDGNKK